MLNPKTMQELRNISAQQNKPSQTFSDVIIFLIKQYRITQLSKDPVTRHIVSIHQNQEQESNQND